VLLGVILSDTNFALSAQRLKANRFVQALGGQVRVGHHIYPDLPLDALVHGLLAHAPGDTSRAPAHAPPPAYRRGLPRDGEALHPSDIACAVNDLMAAHGRRPMAADVGDCLFTAMEMENTQLVAPGYYAGMGFGVPGGLGIQAATGQRPLVLVGDGAFQMTGWELGNCVRYGWDPIVILFNNASWEMLRGFAPESAFNDLNLWNFAQLADALGGRGRRAATRRELAEALDAAVAETGRFQLVEVMLPRGVTSDTLRRFTEGMTARARSNRPD
jgi:indolepyruvate decarboxylase